MGTRSFVAATLAAGILGGVVGALLFLLFFADSFRPPSEPPRTAAPAEPEFSREEAAALRALPRRMEEMAAGLEAVRRERAQGGPRPSSGPPAPHAAPAAPEGDPEEAIRKNERAAVATLRNLATCQAQWQTVGKTDCDQDGIGEFGTFQEMSGAVGVRKGFTTGAPNTSDFSSTGTPANPPILAPAFRTVDSEGRVSRNGYLFQLFLPDSQTPSQFVHETPGPGLSGGTSQISVDLAETTWCMYAWPEEPGKTGRRAFFVNQAGDVMQSSNEVARHGGTASFDPRSAFRGEGITSMVAVGTRGNDGDVWKVSN